MENIPGDLELMHGLEDRDMARDHDELIIIDITLGKTFSAWWPMHCQG